MEIEILENDGIKGGITKDLQTSSVAYGILEYAFFTPVVRLCDCNIAFSGIRGYRSIGSAFGHCAPGVIWR